MTAKLHVEPTLAFTWNPTRLILPSSANLILTDAMRAARLLHAAAIREGIRSELHVLERDINRFNVEKSQRANMRTLFFWNSWARAGHRLRTALFGNAPDDLVRIEWLNSYALLRQGSAAFESLALVSLSPTGLTVFVATCSPKAQAEMGKLESMWGPALR